MQENVIFANYISEKGLISRIKKSYNSIKKIENQLKMGKSF